MGGDGRRTENAEADQGEHQPADPVNMHQRIEREAALLRRDGIAHQITDIVMREFVNCHTKPDRDQHADNRCGRKISKEEQRKLLFAQGMDNTSAQYSMVEVSSS